MNVTSYKDYLASRGNTLGQIKRTQSDVLMNSTFTADPTYKKIYILTKDGWKWEDAKYQTHSAPSILKDPVDYYLQFRPKVHYPIGSYVIVPDDTGFDINLTEDELRNPFSQPIKNRTQWWIIVGRDDSSAFVRYMILKCDWEFRWIYNNKLMTCWACSRNANSYTSGVWRDQYSSSLDDLTQAFLPDTYYTYGEQLDALGMCDTRTVMHGQRFFLSNNDLDPKIYEVTKIKDINPQGVIKLSIKQHELNTKRDNIELRICDFYADNGDIQIDDLSINEIPNDAKYSEIHWMFVNDNDELDYGDDTSIKTLQVGRTSYFKAIFSDENIDAQWRIELDNEEDLDKDDVAYYEGLMRITKFDSTTIALKPGKASSLKGKKFVLFVSDINGEYASSIPMEVSE